MQTVDKKLKSHDAWALFLSIGGGLCFGTSIGIIGGILGDEKFIGLSPSMRGVFSASAAYGIVIGSILPTFLSEIFGRKPMFIFAAFEAFIFTALISAMNSTAGCIIMRALAGIGSGALSATTPAYSAELASDKWRGKFVGLIRVTTMGGVALSQLINIPFNYVKNGWRYEFALVALPNLIVGIITLFCPESGVFLMQKEQKKQKQKQEEEQQEQKSQKMNELTEVDQNNNNQDQQTEQIHSSNEEQPKVQQVASITEQSESTNTETNQQSSTSDSQQTNEQKQQETQEKQNQSKFTQFRKTLVSLIKQCWKELIIGLILSVLSTFTGMNVVLFYLQIVLMNAGVSRRIMSLVLSFVIGTWVCIMATPQLFFIDRVGRKKVLVFGSLIQVIGMFILMLSNLIPYLVDNKIQYYMSLPGIILFLSGIEIGIGPLYLVMISEMYPEQYTSAIISFMVTVMQISGLIVTTAYSPLSSKIGDSGVFIITFTLCMFQIIFSIFFVKETKGMYPRSNMNMNQNMDMDANTNTNAEDGSGNGKENKVSQV